MAIKKQSTSDVVEIKGIVIQVLDLMIVGDTPLITHAWSSKARQMMKDKQAGKATTRIKRTAENIEQEYQESVYWLADGQAGFPAAAFKAATVGACRQYDIMPMTKAKTVLFIEGQLDAQGNSLIPINGVMQRREDMVRLETGVADIRYRYQFWPWRATLRVRFNASVITPEQIVNLVNAGGLGGVGEWRPSAPKSSTGDYGRVHVEAQAPQ